MTEADGTLEGIPAPIDTGVPRVGHLASLEVPLLDTPDDIHTQLAILLQSIGPMFGDAVGQGQIAGDAPDHHLAHHVILVRVGVDILHPPQAGVGLVGVVECPDRFDDVGFQGRDLELRGEEIEVQQRADVAFFFRGADGMGVEPADEEGEGLVFEFGEAVFFRPGGFVLFVVEEGGEEGGVVAEELFVERVVVVLFADIEIDERATEQPVEGGSQSWEDSGCCSGECTHGEAFAASRHRSARLPKTLQILASEIDW